MKLRIGTWNKEGRWSHDHHLLLQRQMCDVWLLTEAPERIEMQGYETNFSLAEFAQGVRWAAVAAIRSERPVQQPDPHPASAAVRWGGTTYISSVLPWNSSGSFWPWAGDTTAGKTEAALQELRSSLQSQHVVWGGDWNHALEGAHTGASRDGRHRIQAEIDRVNLQVPTKVLGHREPGLRSIDHIAVPASWSVAAAKRVRAYVGGKELSDHDAYVVDVAHLRTS
jgi:hypothetical protein